MYPAATGFRGQSAASRTRLVADQRRRGRTLSINWPLWAEGGMRLDASTQALLTEASGMLPLPTDAGLQALHRSLELGDRQVLVIAGQLERLRDALRKRH